MKVSKAIIEKVESYIFRGGERPKDFQTRFYMATVFERQREIMENVTLYMPKDRSLCVHIDVSGLTLTVLTAAALRDT